APNPSATSASAAEAPPARQDPPGAPAAPTAVRPVSLPAVDPGVALGRAFVGSVFRLQEGAVAGRADAGDEDAVALEDEGGVLVADPDGDPAAALVALGQGSLLGVVGG